MTAPRRGSNAERINRRLRAKVRTASAASLLPDPHQRVAFFAPAERTMGFRNVSEGGYMRIAYT